MIKATVTVTVPKPLVLRSSPYSLRKRVWYSEGTNTTTCEGNSIMQTGTLLGIHYLVNNFTTRYLSPIGPSVALEISRWPGSEPHCVLLAGGEGRIITTVQANAILCSWRAMAQGGK